MKTGYIYAFLSAFIWSLGTLSVTYLSRYYGNVEQNFIRIGVAGFVMLCLVLIYRRDGFVNVIKNMHLLILPIFLYSSGQYLWVAGLEKIKPAFAYLIEKSETIITVILAYILLSQERRTIISKKFIFGVILSVAGCVCIIVFRKDFGIEISHGIWYCFAAACMFAFYSVSIKKISANLESLHISTAVVLGLSVFFSIPFFFNGSAVASKIYPGKMPFIVAVISGIVSIGLGNICYMKAIKLLNVSVMTNILLLNTLIVAIGSYFIYGEKLTLLQILSAPLLLLGCALVVQASMKEEKKIKINKEEHLNRPVEVVDVKGADSI